MTSSAPPCPFCGAGSRFALTARDRNKEVTSARFTYNRCQSCGTVFLADVPADPSRYYSGNYYGFDASGEPASRSNPFLQEVEASRVGLLRRYVEPGPLIEIGAGTGGFAAAAKEAGFDVTALEMDSRCCEYLAQRLEVNVDQTEQPDEALNTLPSARVVAMWHVLEHLRNPAEVLAAAADRLEPNGVLAIGAPNPRSLQFRLLGARWAHLDAPRHLCLIPAAALIDRLHSLGLRPLLLTTSDPFGRHCNLHGWTYGFRRRPAHGPKPTKSMLGVSITWMMGPIEHRGENGAAVLLLLGKTPAT